MSECDCNTNESGNKEDCFVCEQKSCDNCGRRKECDNDQGLWRCNGYSAWTPKEIKPDINSALIEIDRMTKERDKWENVAVSMQDKVKRLEEERDELKADLATAESAVDDLMTGNDKLKADNERFRGMLHREFNRRKHETQT
jgi:uncharacterized coiled-coil DUF342 family protein